MGLSPASVAGALGGVGLFLLGMTMLSDGLKLAAGPALERILAAATRTRWHGLGSGLLVTMLVQSSSVVTVATIGFVNAGLLALGPSLWVLFGANVGTTMTGWIVALVGLRFDIQSVALPLIVVGVAAAPERPRHAACADRRRAGRLRPALPGHRDAAAGPGRTFGRTCRRRPCCPPATGRWRCCCRSRPASG